MFERLKEICKRDMKRILLPILIIILCFSALCGATFALFTNDEDGKIGVNTSSGSINIDIIDLEHNSLIGQVLDFDTNTKDHAIYFEPGATFNTEGFMVKNGGNITVNYRIYISTDENENMNKFDEAFELWISEDPDDLSGAVKMTEFEGTLAPGEVGPQYYLVIRMKPEADNDFQTKEYTGIGITVYAVQGNIGVDEVYGQ